MTPRAVPSQPNPVVIRIYYLSGVEVAEATPLGAEPGAAVELFRLQRPSMCIAAVASWDGWKPSEGTP